MKKAFVVLSTVFLLTVSFSPFSLATLQPPKPDKTTKVKILESYGKVPLSFIENRGQVNKKVAYYLNGRQGRIYFTKEGIVYDLLLEKTKPSKETKNATLSKETDAKEMRRRLSFNLKPMGAEKGVRLVAKNKLPGRVNYLIGNDPNKWQTDIPLYKEILYEGLYKGIDLQQFPPNL